jgi:hypothetical protein
MLIPFCNDIYFFDILTLKKFSWMILCVMTGLDLLALTIPNVTAENFKGNPMIQNGMIPSRARKEESRIGAAAHTGVLQTTVPTVRKILTRTYYTDASFLV